MIPVLFHNYVTDIYIYILQLISVLFPVLRSADGASGCDFLQIEQGRRLIYGQTVVRVTLTAQYSFYLQ